jgi:hypothetical protein
MQKNLRNLSLSVEKLAQERENFTRTAQIAIDRDTDLQKTIEVKDTEIESLKQQMARMHNSLKMMERANNSWYHQSLKLKSETRVKDETVADLKAKLSTYEKIKEVIKEMTKADQGSNEAKSQ